MSYHLCCFKTLIEDPCPIDFSPSGQEVLSVVWKMCNTDYITGLLVLMLLFWNNKCNAIWEHEMMWCHFLFIHKVGVLLCSTNHHFSCETTIILWSSGRNKNKGPANKNPIAKFEIEKCELEKGFVILVVQECSGWFQSTLVQEMACCPTTQGDVSICKDVI